MAVNTYLQVKGVANNIKPEVETATKSMLVRLRPSDENRMLTTGGNFGVGKSFAALNYSTSPATFSGQSQAILRWNLPSYKCRVKKFTAGIYFLINTTVNLITLKLFRGNLFMMPWSSSETGGTGASQPTMVLPAALGDDSFEYSVKNFPQTTAPASALLGNADFVVSVPGTSTAGNPQGLIGAQTVLDTNPIASVTVSNSATAAKPMTSILGNMPIINNFNLIDTSMGDYPVELVENECLVLTLTSHSTITQPGTQHWMDINTIFETQPLKD